MDPNLTEANNRIQKALEHLQQELASIRAGKANPSLLENIPVFAYGSQMKMLEVGTISAPQHSLLTIHVWDAGIVKDVEKAVMEANLGLNPSTEGNTVRVPIPALNEERREEFIKLAHQKAEITRVELRQIRHETRGDWEDKQKSGEIGEDELARREKLLQELIDKITSKIDEYLKAKEEDLRQI